MVTLGATILRQAYRGWRRATVSSPDIRLVRHGWQYGSNPRIHRFSRSAPTGNEDAWKLFGKASGQNRAPGDGRVASRFAPQDAKDAGLNFPLAFHILRSHSVYGACWAFAFALWWSGSKVDWRLITRWREARTKRVDVPAAEMTNDSTPIITTSGPSLKRAKFRLASTKHVTV
jgi:hypothetical protein